MKKIYMYTIVMIAFTASFCIGDEIQERFIRSGSSPHIVWFANQHAIGDKLEFNLKSPVNRKARVDNAFVPNWGRSQTDNPYVLNCFGEISFWHTYVSETIASQAFARSITGSLLGYCGAAGSASDGEGQTSTSVSEFEYILKRGVLDISPNLHYMFIGGEVVFSASMSDEHSSNVSPVDVKWSTLEPGQLTRTDGTYYDQDDLYERASSIKFSSLEAGLYPVFGSLLPERSSSIRNDVQLDVGDGLGGGPDGDAYDAGDGFLAFLPGYNDGEGVISSDGISIEPQMVNIIIEVPSLYIKNIKLKLENTSNHSGYCTNADISVALDKDYYFKVGGSYTDLYEINTSVHDTYEVPLYCFDYGGSTDVKIEYFDENGVLVLESNHELPMDYDDDGIADAWEYQMIDTWNSQYGVNISSFDLTFFNGADDLEERDPDGSVTTLSPHDKAGDGFTVFEEYRGIDFHSESEWGGSTGHIRLDPARKEFLVEVDIGEKDNGLITIGNGAFLEVMEITQEVLLDSAGVKMYYVVDQVRAP